MSRTSRIAFALLISCAAVSPAASAVVIFTGTLSGDQEVGPVASPGFGNVVVTWNDIAHTMQIEATFSDLLGPTTAAHIHAPAPPGVNVGVATTLPSFPGFPLGVTSGSMNQTFDMTLASSYSASFITNFGGGTVAGAEAALLTALLEGQAYFNIHTSEVPGGEIRANLSAIPEPGTWALMLGGFAAVGLAFRRRRTMRPVAA